MWKSRYITSLEKSKDLTTFEFTSPRDHKAELSKKEAAPFR